eukprot:XP_011664594.1 PREDICTED: uncharacterized protein LOC105438468 [Strongylocentrotus purpuratus]
MSGVTLTKSPSLGIHIGHSIIKCCQIKRGQCIRSGDTRKKQDADNFKELFEAEWTDLIASPARQALKERVFFRVQDLPTTADLRRLLAFTEKAVVEGTAKLHTSSSSTDWRKLANTIFVASTVFNKRLQHSDEPQVACLIVLPHKKRDCGFEKLRLLGDFEHNLSILDKKQGELFLLRRPTKQRVVEDFLPCIHCLGFVSLGEMWRHVRNCRHATSPNSTEPEDNSSSTIAHARMLLDGASLNTSERVWRVIVNSMRERGDERTVDAVKKDPLILRFGLCGWDGQTPHVIVLYRLEEIGKRHFCCLKVQHSDEPQVACLIALPHKKRDCGFEKLRLLGDFQHNLSILDKKQGELFLLRRPTKQRVVEDFLPCIHCLGFVSLGEMWRHVRNCRHATSPNSTEPEDNSSSTIAQARMLLDGASLNTSERVWRVIVSSMRERGDERTVDAVQKDPLILRFGAMLLERRGAARKNEIGQRMRQLGRLVV